MLNKKIRSAGFVYTQPGLSKFFAASSTTMESLPLKGLDFGLLKRTGPSSGVVASIVLVSPGLECPGVSLVEVCATCLGITCGSLVIEVQYLKTFYELQYNF